MCSLKLFYTYYFVPNFYQKKILNPWFNLNYGTFQIVEYFVKELGILAKGSVAPNKVELCYFKQKAVKIIKSIVNSCSLSFIYD